MTNLILSALESRNDRDWIGGLKGKQIAAIAHQTFQELAQYLADLSPGSTLPKILLCETEPVKFLGRFMAAVSARCPIFLGNPHWSETEWQQVFGLVQPDIIWGKCLDGSILATYREQTRIKTTSFVTSDTIQSGIMIPTGGSSGKIRFAIHTWETLTSSVQGFTEYFQISTVNSVCLLPLYHVSGLMQFLRSFISGGTFVSLPSYKDILEGNLLGAIASDPVSQSNKHTSELEKIEIDPATFFISLVPTQLARLLQNPTAAKWLSQFKTVLLGGSPAWPQLLDMARQQRINLAPTYGMTETASQVVTLKPEDFLAGNNSCGRVLPHANISICGEDGRQLDINQIGIIRIRANSLALGYVPAKVKLISKPKENPPDFISDDLGFFDADGFLNIVGRRSDKIITGGENVFPAEVEAAIRTTGLVRDVCAIALPDPDWGQAIAAIYVAKSSGVCAETLARGLVNRLAKFKHPKYWVPVAQLPRNSQGKINRDRLYQIAESWRLSQP